LPDADKWLDCGNCHAKVSLDADTCPQCGTVPKKPFWYRLPDSQVRETAVKIMAMRLAGASEDEICNVLGILKETAQNYIYIAGRNGWLTYHSAREHIENTIIPKVLRNIEEGLDDKHRHQTSGMSVGTAVALKVAEGTVFKRFDDHGGQAPVATMIAVKIEMPVGALPTIREGTTGGTPAYLEGEVAK
jgi:hypothetical protein